MYTYIYIYMYRHVTAHVLTVPYWLLLGLSTFLSLFHITWYTYECVTSHIRTCQITARFLSAFGGIIHIAWRKYECVTSHIRMSQITVPYWLFVGLRTFLSRFHITWYTYECVTSHIRMSQITVRFLIIFFGGVVNVATLFCSSLFVWLNLFLYQD